MSDPEVEESSPLLNSSQKNHGTLKDNTTNHPEMQQINADLRLFDAVNKGCLQTTQALLDQGENVERLNDDGDTVLHIAAREDRTDLIGPLVEKASVVDCLNSEGESPIQIAVERGHTNIALTLYKHGADINKASDPDIPTLLHVAISTGHIKTANMLINNGARLDIPDAEGNVPLHLAAKRGFEDADLGKLLVNRGESELVRQNDKGNTPLHIAAIGGHYKSVRLFVDHNAPVTLSNNKGNTSLHFAAQSGYAMSGQMIIEKDKQVLNQANNDKLLPIHKAVIHGRLKMVQALLDIYAQDDQLWTEFLSKVSEANSCLMDMAVDNGHDKIAAKLIQHKEWKAFLLEESYINGRVRMTPMRKLILNMPEIASQVLDKCWQSSAGFAVANYEVMDDMFCHWNVPREDMTSSKVQLLPEDDQIVEYSDDEPYSRDVAILKSNHPLKMVANIDVKELIDHPLTHALLRRKWGVAVTVYSVFLLFYVMFISTLTAFMVKSTPPFGEDLCSNTTGNKTLPSTKDHYQFGLAVAVLVFATIGIVMEFVQLALTRISNYIEFHNLLDWFTYISPILVVTDFTGCGALTDWQWQLGITSVFISYMNMLYFLRIIPVLGIYVMMIVLMIQNFLHFFSIMFLYIFSFAVCFYLLLQNQVSFSTLPFSIMKSYVMMIGDLDFTGIFHEHRGNDDPEVQLHYEGMTWLLFIAFLIFMFLIIMNLLTSLAVNGVESLQQDSKYKILALQIDLALDVEFALPYYLHDKLHCVVHFEKFSIKETGNPLARRIKYFFESSIYGSLCEKYIVKEALQIINMNSGIDDGSEPAKSLSVKDVENCIVRKTRGLRSEIKEIDKNVESLNKQVKAIDEKLSEILTHLKKHT